MVDVVQRDRAEGRKERHSGPVPSFGSVTHPLVSAVPPFSIR